MTRRIRVQASPHDPETLRFVLDAPVDAAAQEGAGTTIFHDPADQAPLAAALFAVPGVRRVEVHGPSIHIRRHPEAGWEDMKAGIAAAIRAVLDGTEFPLGKRPERDDGDSDARLLDEVRDLLGRRVNPSISGHGGKITAERVEGGTVYLRMSGGCQGCASSQLTLRSGVERTLRSELPEIRDIVDVTDHSAGRTPFYGRASGQSPAIEPPVRADSGMAAGDDLAARVRHHLAALPASGPTVAYGALARALGFWMPGSVRKITQALEETMREDARTGRPFIAARAVSRIPGGLPGKGFLDLARTLSRGPQDGETEQSFHAREIENLARSLAGELARLA